MIFKAENIYRLALYGKKKSLTASVGDCFGKVIWGENRQGHGFHQAYASEPATAISKNVHVWALPSGNSEVTPLLRGP